MGQIGRVGIERRFLAAPRPLYLRISVRRVGAEPANVFEDRAVTGQWRVEWFDDDGRCELEIFTGHDARRQALRYAMRKYGHFREVQLEEQSEAPFAVAAIHNG